MNILKGPFLEIIEIIKKKYYISLIVITPKLFHDKVYSFSYSPVLGKVTLKSNALRYCVTP